MAIGAVKLQLVTAKTLPLSRQRPRVRVPSSPPFIPKELGEFPRNHQGHEKGTFRAPFVPFFRLCAKGVLWCSAAPIGRKDQ